ncbi:MULTISPECIES: hypothetical protein [unclassified Sphingomonas]|uniref:hypothetical protein n=1 Tax=unclassified Sphingomonas TaxID=196159 RepID=UPI002269A7AE|nr:MULTISPECIES: hypothetical protein [unclassified Sphingomonas]
MLNQTNADHTAKLFHAAVEQAGDIKSAALTLIAAAMACQEILRGVMPAAKVNDMLSVLSVAGAVLFDDDCGGLLDAVIPLGRA